WRMVSTVVAWQRFSGRVVSDCGSTVVGMSISPLVVDAVPSGAASVPSWLDDLDTLVDAGARLDVSGLAGPAAMDAVTRLGQVTSRLAAVRLALLGHIDQTNAARTRLGATSTAAWLHSTGTAPGAAAREVALARSLEGHQPTRDALAG